MKNRSYSFSLLVLLLGAAPVLACDPDDPAPNGAASAAAVSELFANYIEKCGEGDALEVREIRRGQYPIPPGQTFDAATVAACTRAVNAGLCDEPSCAQVYPIGTLEDGAACREGTQCKSARCGDDNGVCSTCKPNPACGSCAAGTVCTPTGCSPLPVVAKVGEACSPAAAPLTVCARGASCDNRTGKCVKDGEVGGSCADGPCTSNAYCDYASDRCAAAKPAGAKCSGPGSFECQKGLACAAGVCKAFTAVPLGKPCDDASLCDGGVCDTKTGLCKAYPKAGESCEDFDTCADGFRCDGETCVTTDAYFCK